MEASVFWTMCAAIATTLSALVIGWQSFETRKSAGEAKRSANASEKAVTAANVALELTRQQAKHSQLMAAESIRLRMESQGPSLSVIFPVADADGGPVPTDFVFGPSATEDSYDFIEPGHEFWETKDDDVWFYAVLWVVFENTGPHPVTVSSEQMFLESYGGKISVRQRRIMVPGASGGDSSRVTAYILVGTRLSNWIWVTKQDSKANLVGGSAGWATELAGEAGVQVTQTFKLMGTLLETGTARGQYLVRGFGPDVNFPSYMLIEPQKRTYFIGQDREGNRHALPPIEPEEVNT